MIPEPSPAATHDLDLTADPGGEPWHEFAPAACVRGQAEALFDSESLGLLRKHLITTLGADTARALLHHWGGEMGRRDAIGQPFSWESDAERLLCGPRLRAWLGEARMGTRRVALNQARGVVDVEVVWHHSPEAEQHVAQLGYADHAVCWTLSGYYAGYCSALLGRPVRASETTCAGMGAEACTIRLRAAEAAPRGQAVHTALQPGHVVHIMQGELERLRFESSMRQGRLEALREAVLDVTGELMLDGVQAKIVSRGRVLLGARYGFLVHFNEPTPPGLAPGHQGSVIIHDGLSRQDAAELEPFPLTTGLFVVVLRDNATIRVRRAGEDPRTRGVPLHPALLASFLGVPVRVHGQLCGALYFTDRLDGGEFSLDDEKLAESFAAHAGVALENARYAEASEIEREQLKHALGREQEVTSELHHLRGELEREQELLRELVTIPDIPDVDSALHKVLDRLVTLLEADTGTILLAAPGPGQSQARASAGALYVRAVLERGRAVDVDPRGACVQPGRGVSGRVAQARDIIYVRDLSDDVEAPEPHLPRGLRSLIAAPLLAEGRLIGVVQLGSFAVRTFDGPEVRFLRAAADRTALSIEHARLHHEITRSDQLLRAVIEAAPIGMSVTVPEGEGARTVLANGVMRRLEEIGAQAGVPPAGDAPGRALAGEVVRRFEQDLVHPLSGHVVSVRVSAAPVRPPGGAVQAAVTVVEELTLEKEIERLRERFVSLVAHDLRNPLNAAMMHLELLRERLDLGRRGGAGQDELVSESLRTAEAISRSMERVSDLVSDLLDYSRLEAGQLKVHPGPVPLRPLLRELLDEMRPLLGGRLLELDIADSLPPLWADRRRLAQVLTNLLSNTAKYTPAETRMGLRARLCDPIEAAFLSPLTPDGEEGPPPRTWVLITVWDEGPGIPPEARPRLFDPFYRLSRDQQAREGTGLGLYITRGLVEAHGGQIWIDDVPGASFSMLWAAVD